MLGVLYLLLVCLGIASGFGFSSCGGSWVVDVGWFWFRYVRGIVLYVCLVWWCFVIVSVCSVGGFALRWVLLVVY